MSRFTNKLCPVCRAPFSENADVVVCPECGTPHHRACWIAKNRCGVEQYHAEGFVWRGRLPDEPQPDNIVEQAESVQDEFVTEKNVFIGDDPESAMMEADEYMNKVFRSFADKTQGADGVSMMELCTFAAKSTFHYGSAFSRFRGINGIKKGKASLNICAGLFAPIHQLYRGDIVFSILVTAATVLTSLPALLEYSGILTYTDENASMFMALVMITNLLNFALTVALCVFSDYIYYKYAVRQIKRVREDFGEERGEEYYQALQERGRPSWLRAIIGLLAVALVTACIVYFPTLLAG